MDHNQAVYFLRVFSTAQHVAQESDLHLWVELGGLSTLPYGPHPQQFFKFPIAKFLSCLPPSLRHISLVRKYESFLWGPLTPKLGMLAYLLTVLDKGRG